MAQAPDLHSIFVDLPEVTDADVNREVGSIYEVGINGSGYMLDDSPEEQGYEGGAVPLLPDRLATTETPLSESINRYQFYDQSLFEGGQGQKVANRLDDDPRKYNEGLSIDPFTEAGTVRLGLTETLLFDSGYSNPRLATVADTLYVQTGDDELTYLPTATPVTITDGAPITIEDLASDGTRWYVATGTSVVRGTTSNPATAWSTVDANRIASAAGRIMAASIGAGSVTGNIFTTLTDSGTEENTGGHFTLPAGHQVELGGPVAGFYYFAGVSGGSTSVYAWQLGLDESQGFYTPFEAWALPVGAEFVDIHAASGSVWVQTREAGKRVLYRALPDGSGRLTAVRVGDDTDSAAVGSAVFEWDNKIMMLFPNRIMAAVGLTYGGLARISGAVGDTGELHDGVVYDASPCVSTSDGKVWTLGPYSTVGWVSTPIWDGGSTLDKVFDDVTVACEPLGAGESITVSYTTDRGRTFAQAGTVQTQGATKFVFPLGVSAVSIGLRVTMTTTTGQTTPVMSSVQVRTHPLGLVDGVLMLPIKCADQLEGLNGSIIPGSRPGRGAEMARELEALAGKRVKVQDVDWPWTGLVDIYEVLEVRRNAWWLQAKQRPQLQQRVMLMLRKTV